MSSEVLYNLTRLQYPRADKAEIEEFIKVAHKKNLVVKKDSTTFSYYVSADAEVPGNKARVYVFKAEDWLTTSDYEDLKKEM